MNMAADQPLNNRDRDRDRHRGWRDLLIFLLILLLGFVCVWGTAQMAVKPGRSWQASANMFSEVDPLWGFEDIEAGELRLNPLRPEVMTPPVWDLTRLAPVGTPVVVPAVTFPPIAGITSTPQQVVGVPTTPAPGETATLGETVTPPTFTPTPTQSRTPTPTRTPTGTPTPTNTPTPTPTGTPTPTHTPTPTPTDTPSPPPRPATDTPTPTDTPTNTPTPTDTPTPAAPVVLSITPKQGLNSTDIPVTISGADFVTTPALPEAWLGQVGGGTQIMISAATTDTLTGTVPAGLIAGVYALTVINPDGQRSVSPPWVYYTALSPSSPDTTLETGYLATFGLDAPGADGDDDYVQVIFLEVPDGTPGDLFVRVFDADSGGTLDEPGTVTTMRYALFGGDGAYTSARSAHPDAAQIESGILLTETTVIGDDAAYDDNWNLVFGPYLDDDGESVRGSRVFKLVVQGISGDSGNWYNVTLSTVSDNNVLPIGARIFAYSWTFPLARDRSQRPYLYPFVPSATGSFEQHNFDADFVGGVDTMTLHTPVRNISVLSPGLSGEANEAFSSYLTIDGEIGTTWTVTMDFAFGDAWNYLTFWAVGNADLPIFTHSTTSPPP
jgi:hypothetical protein